MTIIAAYPSECGVVFVSDFRVTFRDGTQKDRCIKFIEVEGKMGLFLSGDTSFWKRAIPRIAAAMEQMTTENIFALDGPLNQLLNEEAINHTGKRAGAIGFLLGTPVNETIFTAIITPQLHCELRQVVTNEPIVLGKGGDIPNIHQIIKNSFQSYAKYYESDLFLIGAGIRTEILTKLQSIDNGFEKFGISPTMVVSRLKDGDFIVCGEERTGFKLSRGECHLFKYNYESNDAGKITIVDSVTDEVFSLVNIDEISTDTEGGEFDPEKLS